MATNTARGECPTCHATCHVEHVDDVPCYTAVELEPDLERDPALDQELDRLRRERDAARRDLRKYRALVEAKSDRQRLEATNAAFVEALRRIARGLGSGMHQAQSALSAAGIPIADHPFVGNDPPRGWCMRCFEPRADHAEATIEAEAAP